MPDIFVASNKNTGPSSPVKPALAPDASNTKTNHPHLTSAFCEYPDYMKFQDQEPDETILLFLRRHFITNLHWIIIGIFFALLPIAFIVLAGFGMSFFNFPFKFTLIFLIFYYFIVLNYFFVNYITWYFNISFITEKRVIDIDFSGLVYKNVAATKINLVQDVSYAQTGVLRSVFDYGDVLVQTAGNLENFDFVAVPHPAKVVSIVEQLIGRRPLNV